MAKVHEFASTGAACDASQTDGQIEDGGHLRGVSHSPSRVIGLSGPSWSPDGTKLLFSDDYGKLYIANADGSGLIRRVTPVLKDGYPWGSLSWSSR